MQSIGYLLALILCSTQLAMAAADAAWTAVAALTPGQTVRVQTATERHDGVLASVSDSAVTLTPKLGGTVSVDRTNVQRVYVRKGSHRVRNTIIGAAVGVGVGAVIYGTLGSWFRNEGHESTEYMLAVPIAVGTGIGAALPSGGMHKIYDARR
jgi:hypothetical protein